LAAGRPPAPLGVILFFSFGGLFLRFWKANLWRAENGTWLAHLRDVLTNREDKLPEVGKYNAGQKAVFWLMSILIIIRICTGIVIWAQYFYPLTSIVQKRWTVLGHSAADVTIICVWIVHLYAAIWVRGTIGAMTRGQVTGGWAWRHHRKWLRELVTGKAEDRSAGAKSVH
jgi:formate dehydrogenase subunit gamma